MIFRQFLHEPLAAASYLVGCAACGEAAVVDPCLAAEHYALFAADKGLRITAILETHMHADYISSARALAALCGAEIALPRRAEACFPHRPLDDGDVVDVGNVRITALHTPGHTPEHLAYLISDLPRAERPWFVLTGDCLFVGDVGRADLVDLPLTGSDYLYDSIFGKLLALPDDVELYPGHYGGSACGGKAMSGKVSSTIGFERRFNAALQVSDRAAFMAQVDATPRAAVEDVLLHRNTNRGELPLPPGYGAPDPAFALGPDAPALTAQDVQALAEVGAATIVDVRQPRAFADRHPAGALAAQYSRPSLAQWVANLCEPGAPLVLVADQPFVARAAAQLLGGGRNPVAGYLDRSVDGCEGAGLPSACLPTLSVDELHRHVAADLPVLDVREPFEWERGVIPQAALIGFGEVRERAGELPPGRPLAVVCESGARATAVASLLRRQGVDAAAVMPDGMSEYARRYPVVVER
jgi:hydroxyacylglutathione hydrolase